MLMVLCIVKITSIFLLKTMADGVIFQIRTGKISEKCLNTQHYRKTSEGQREKITWWQKIIQ